MSIKLSNIDHLGLVAGIIDEIGIEPIWGLFNKLQVQ